MRKVKNILGLIFFSALSAGLFGIIHDQISYTVSPEYYTKFKFIQFKIPDYFHDRIGAAIVGWNATWWFGLILGIILLVFIRKDLSHEGFLSRAMKTIGLILLLSISIAVLGLLFGFLFLEVSSPNWIIPEEVLAKRNYLAVGSMHTFAYVGGIIGLIVGMRYHKKINKAKA